MVRQRVVVRGRVQGVSFRYSCRNEAVAAGVSGWVTNRSDGHVEAVFEGDADAVDRLVAWCRQGPPAARVEGVSVVDEDPTGVGGFGVR